MWNWFVVVLCLGGLACAPPAPAPVAPPQSVAATRATPDAAPPGANAPVASDDLPAPASEVHTTDQKVDLPAVPAFDLPTGVLSVKQLRVATKQFLGQRVTLHGFVTYAYECVAAVRKPGEPERVAQRRIDDDPTLCMRPRYYVGDGATTPPDQSLWVVDVPRPYNKLELQRMKKPQRTLPDRCEPGEKDPAKLVCPPYRVGDEVVVVGTFAIRSAHGDANSDGLLLFEAMHNVTRSWQTPNAGFELTVPPQRSAATPAPLPPLPGPVASPAADASARARSRSSGRDGSEALARASSDPAQLDRARAAYKLALDAWAGNHLAWYGLGLVELKANHAADAVTALDHAVALAPDHPMYQMFDGIAHYTAAESAPTPSYDRAVEHLRRAIAEEPRLWRAHYYLGRIAREQDRARDAASEFTAAVVDDPRERGPYIALAELYRRWDYIDQSLAVATQGTTYIASARDAADLFYLVGMDFDAKHQPARAIEAYTRALDADPDNQKARFQRGQAYFLLGDAARAEPDLEDFVTGPSPPGLDKEIANRFLQELAAKPARR